jgi:carboxyl-terminal processing protease
MVRKYGVLSAAIFAIVVSALVGGLLGRNALATATDVSDYRTFTAALGAVEANYVDTVDSKRLVYSSIGGMLQTLDPHSSFMDPDYYKRMRERQEGHYFGLGITIQVIDRDINVSALFEGTPAYKKGIRRGDVIVRIAGEDTRSWTDEQGKPLSGSPLSEKAVSRLRGPKGTLVKVGLKRPGYDQVIEIEVPRDEINIPSITAWFMVDAQTGYVKVQDFAENTNRDLGNALRDLKAKGMKRLLLDLRGNPGGPLDQAIKVSNRFLPQGSLIVFTRGRVPNSDQDYVATERSEYTDLPLVVLVSRNSASASEIVSGALQDYDRGLIVGETTFGKALVQSVYRISDNAGLALTTARYYTPSKRLIQRPWDGTFDEYQTYTLKDQTEKVHPATDLRYTTGGRKVYSGGGIEPDKRMDGPIEGFNPTRFGRALYARQVFATFAERFVAEGDTRIAPRPDQRPVARDFVVDDGMVKEFKDFLVAQKVKVEQDLFVKDSDFIRAMIRYDIDLALFGLSEARRNLLSKDPQALFAIQLFPEAEKLGELRKAKEIKPSGNH